MIREQKKSGHPPSDSAQQPTGCTSKVFPVYHEPQRKSTPRIIGSAGLGALAAIDLALFVLPTELKSRGYFAIGGEWILIIAVGLIVGFGVNRIWKGIGDGC